MPVNPPTPVPVNPPTPVPVNPPTPMPVNPPSQDASCESNSGCASRGLKGQCCPTIKGFDLDCCQQPPLTQGPTQSPSIDMSSCKDNPGCAVLKLEGLCCPTIDGVDLDCCDDDGVSASPSTFRVKVQQRPTVRQHRMIPQVFQVFFQLILQPKLLPLRNVPIIQSVRNW